MDNTIDVAELRRAALAYATHERELEVQIATDAHTEKELSYTSKSQKKNVRTLKKSRRPKDDEEMKALLQKLSVCGKLSALGGTPAEAKCAALKTLEVYAAARTEAMYPRVRELGKKEEKKLRIENLQYLLLVT